MKRFILTSFSGLFLVLNSNHSFAREIWTGPGKIYDRDRVVITEYEVEVKIDAISPAESRIDVKVTNAQGKQLESNICSMLKQNKAWTKTCNDGSSQGYLFDYGLGIDYYTRNDGTVFVTNMVFDGSTTMRLMRTELKDGKAVHFFSETLTKK